MSFLSILLVASAFYFAHARPDTQSGYESFFAAQPDDYAGASPDHAYPDQAYPDHAYPDQAYPDQAYADHGYPVPEDSSVPITNSKDYQHQLIGFMNEVSKAIDQYVTPLMSKLDVKKQDELKNMGMNGFGSYVSYLFLLIDEEKEKGDSQSKIQEDSLPRHEIIMQVQSPYSLDPDTPYMADTEVDNDEDDDADHAE